jgi:hypothetical protein
LVELDKSPGKAVIFNQAAISLLTSGNLGLLGKRARINVGYGSWSQQFSAHKMDRVRSAVDRYWFFSHLRMMNFSRPVTKKENELPQVISDDDACRKYGGNACK